jgi:hypothetical protein
MKLKISLLIISAILATITMFSEYKELHFSDSCFFIPDLNSCNSIVVYLFISISIFILSLLFLFLNNNIFNFWKKFTFIYLQYAYYQNKLTHWVIRKQMEHYS